MSDFSYVPLSDAQGEFEFPENPLAQITEEQIKKNFCFIVVPSTNEVIFFKTGEMWKEASKLLNGFEYRVFYCYDILRAKRTKNIK
jgi:hypothetical protein